MNLLKILTTALFLPLLAYAADGEEIPATEAQAIRQIVQLAREQVESAAKKDGHAFRDAHRKQHGCVRAEFSVEKNLSDKFKQGLFAIPKNYSAWIRYSNGSSQAQSDHNGDGRGMAVKVLGVNGLRNLTEIDDEVSSQDFLMINHPVFFVRSAESYVGFQQAVANGGVLWWLLNPMRIFHEGRIAKAIQGKAMMNPLNASYFSMTASKLGTEQMKFRATPCPASAFKNPSNSKNRLRENLEATLENSSACFLFQAQLRNSKSLSVEDPTIDWSEDTSPFITIAKITVPAQVPEQGEFCEALSFNPWNGLAEHRPLGGLSRVRKEVYQAISRLRHDLNKQRREEPKD